MLKSESLKDLLATPGQTRVEKVLLCLARQPLVPRQVKEVRETAIALGLPDAARWNISQLLSQLQGLAIRTKAGWELTSAGQTRVGELAGSAINGRANRVAVGLRGHLGAIQDDTTRGFVEEAVQCLENALYRAAIVLSWVGAVSVLQQHVVRLRLQDFNREARRRFRKWKPARTADDLSRIREADFLLILESISVVGKSVKQELENALRLRNGCGHPNSLQVGEAKAAAHVESLILNVYSKF